MFGQTNGHRKSRRAAVGRFEFGPPSSQFFLGVASCRGFIDRVIDLLAEGIDGIHRRAPLSWEEEKGIVEVASALLGESGAVGLCVTEGE